MTPNEYDAIVPDGRDPYGRPFFKFCEGDHGWSNDLFARVLFALFKPASVVEFGCGTGRTLAVLQALGVQVRGVDGSAACLDFVEMHGGCTLRDRIQIAPLEEPLSMTTAAGGPFDLVVSVEALEHVRPEGADTAVRTLCAAGEVVVATACPPVGRNPLHLNEQEFPYWVEKFRANGKELDPGATDALRDLMRVFARLNDSGRCPVVPAWFFSHYIGVFAPAGRATLR